MAIRGIAADVDGQEDEIWTGETKILVDAEEDGEVGFRLRTKSKYAAKAAWNSDVVDFLYELQCLCSAFSCSEFHAYLHMPQAQRTNFPWSSHYRGKGPWKDWVWVDWGAHGRVPCHIWCFVVLENMPTGRNALHFGGIPLLDGVFAVVESSEIMVDDAEVTKSDLLMPISKEIEIGWCRQICRQKNLLSGRYRSF